MSDGARASSRRRAHGDRRLSFLERLGARAERVGSCLCVGLDPDPAALPHGFRSDVAGIESFSRLLIEATSPYAAAFKANLAFFEAFGSAGIAALERIRASLPPDLPFIADAKRADIASTATRQAVALFDVLGADAITVNPYLGLEGIAPLLERQDRLAYVLCRNSNPGAGEFQDLAVAGGEPLYVHVARRVAAWAESGAHVGLVVGATAPEELARVREAAPALAFLVLGVGAQGGDLDMTLAHGPARTAPGIAPRACGLLVNISRGIASAALESADPGAAIANAAREWARQLRC